MLTLKSSDPTSIYNFYQNIPLYVKLDIKYSRSKNLIQNAEPQINLQTSSWTKNKAKLTKDYNKRKLEKLMEDLYAYVGTQIS